MRSAVLGLSITVSAIACTGEVDNAGPSAAPSATGGVSGGAGPASGGSMPTGGSVSSMGGAVATGGGAATGGASTGGSSAGAVSLGGMPSGGVSTGGSESSGGASGGTVGGSATGGSGGDLPTTLGPRVGKTSVTVSAGVKDGVQNWSIWGRRDLQVAPVFTAPLPSCQTLVCYTSGDGTNPTAHVLRLGMDDQLDQELVTEDGVECRGLAAGDDGQFAALLWNDERDADPPLDTIAIHRYDAAGSPLGATELKNADNHPTDFALGDSRLEFGGGRYGAYYHVHSLSGHEGDTLKWVDATGGAETTAWDWGCSHSMSNLLRYHPGAGQFMPACVTDCYPGTNGDFSTMSIGGIYLNHDDEEVMDVDAGCNGSVAAELGSAALSPDGWKMVFNAHQAPATPGDSSYNESSMNQDIGFASVAGDRSAGAVVWLTDTAGVNEGDASIAAYQPEGATEQYLVGWVEDDGDAYRLAIVDASGSFVEAAIDVTATVQWGRRDDPFRQHYDGDVVWAWFDQAGSTTLNFARVESGVAYACQ